MNQRIKIGIVSFCFGLCIAAAIVHRWFEANRELNSPSAIYGVVWQQIDAVRSSDWPRAYQQVSSSFADRYNVTTFAELTRAEFPASLRATHVEFGSIRRDGTHVFVHAYFVFENGVAIPCVYRLVQEEGTWKIDSTQVLHPRGTPQRLSGMRL